MEKFDHYFSNHIAEKIELDTVTIVDYYNPEKGYEYNLRYFFDKRNSSLAITGDFGELVARNFYNMGQWDKFYLQYTENLGYFLEKLLTSTRPVHYFDREKAEKLVLNRFFEVDDEEELIGDDYWIFYDLFADFDEESGFDTISTDFYDRFAGDFEIYEIREELSTAGRYVNDVFELYLDAYRRAYEYLTKEVENG